MNVQATVHTQQHYRVRIVLLVLSVLLAALMLLSLCLGRYPVSPHTALQILWSGMTGLVPSVPTWTGTDVLVVNTVRLPRVVVASLAGAALGLSGATLQGLFRNPLVGPQVVGISNGAAWGGVVAILLGASSVGSLAWTFGFAMLALVAVFSLSRLSGNASIMSVVLAGIIVSAFFTALVGLAEFLADAERQLPGIVYWLLGSFATVTRTSLWVIGLPVLIAGIPLLLMRWHINVLSLGDETATALGLRAPQLRWLVLCLVTLLVTAQVGWAGGATYCATPGGTQPSGVAAGVHVAGCALPAGHGRHRTHDGRAGVADRCADGTDGCARVCGGVLAIAGEGVGA